MGSRQWGEGGVVGREEVVGVGEWTCGGDGVVGPRVGLGEAVGGGWGCGDRMVEEVGQWNLDGLVGEGRGYGVRDVVG